MTDPQHEDETKATSMESLTWPDPSRPIINHRPPSVGRDMAQDRPPFHHDAHRRSRWPVLLGVVLGIGVALVVVLVLL